jgi:DNA-binding response OmpR family regulator
MTRILVIEDEASLREDLVEALIEAGFEALGVADGRAGLAEISSNVPDLVICDRVMPEMGGVELLEQIRRDRPDLDTMPFVFLTALNDSRDRFAISDLAPTLYLGKPIDHRVLLRVIGDIIGARGAR